MKPTCYIDDSRWRKQVEDDDEKLTDTEITAGWHFCWDWDGLLIGPGMEELKACTCHSVKGQENSTASNRIGRFA